MSDKVFTMRIKEELLEKIRISAEKNKRSIAKEIEYLLETNLDILELENSTKDLFARNDNLEKSMQDIAKRIANISERLEELSNKKKNI